MGVYFFRNMDGLNAMTVHFSNLQTCPERQKAQWGLHLFVV